MSGIEGKESENLENNATDPEIAEIENGECGESYHLHNVFLTCGIEK